MLLWHNARLICVNTNVTVLGIVLIMSINKEIKDVFLRIHISNNRRLIIKLLSSSTDDEHQ